MDAQIKINKRKLTEDDEPQSSKFKKLTTEQPNNKRKLTDNEQQSMKFRKLTTDLFDKTQPRVLFCRSKKYWFNTIDLTRALDMPEISIKDKIDGIHVKHYVDIIGFTVNDFENNPIFVDELGTHLFVVACSQMPKAKLLLEWILSKTRYDIHGDQLKNVKQQLQVKDEQLVKQNETLVAIDRQWKEKCEQLTHIQKLMDRLDKDIAWNRAQHGEMLKQQILKDKQLQAKDKQLEAKDQQLTAKDEIIQKIHLQLTCILPTCVPVLHDNQKNEELRLYRLKGKKQEYYAIRRQLGSIGTQDSMMLKKGAELVARIKSPNSVNTFNYIFEKMGDMIERTDINRFIMRDNEKKVLLSLENLMVTTYMKRPEIFIRDEKMNTIP